MICAIYFEIPFSWKCLIWRDGTISINIIGSLNRYTKTIKTFIINDSFPSSTCEFHFHLPYGISRFFPICRINPSSTISFKLNHTILHRSSKNMNIIIWINFNRQNLSIYVGNSNIITSTRRVIFVIPSTKRFVPIVYMPTRKRYSAITSSSSGYNMRLL